jgi:hypothetical protein
LENAQAMAAHEKSSTTKLYDRTDDQIKLDGEDWNLLIDDETSPERDSDEGPKLRAGRSDSCPWSKPVRVQILLDAGSLSLESA